MFEQLTLEAALYICRHMRQSDRECLDIIMGQWSVEHFALTRWQSEGAAWAFFQDDRPVVMGGLAVTAPWLATAWMLSVDGVTNDSWKKIIRHSRIVFANATLRYRRIDACVLSTWTQAEKYARQVGFELQNVKKQAGRDGQDLLEFAILGKDQ